MKPISEYVEELRGLDQHNIGSWPSWAYGLAITVVALVILLISGWYFVLPKRDALADAKRHESQLKQTYRIKQAQVANLDAYRDQLADMKSQFGNLLAQLPSKTEVPKLLRDISQTRSENGLDEELFKPEPESKKDFYAALPNDLIVTGDFNEFGTFVSDVAALPRIVTISNVHIKRVGANSHKKNKQNQGPLRMSLTASTYRYLGAGANDDTKTRGKASS